MYFKRESGFSNWKDNKYLIFEKYHGPYLGCTWLLECFYEIMIFREYDERGCFIGRVKIDTKVFADKIKLGIIIPIDR